MKGTSLSSSWNKDTKTHRHYTLAMKRGLLERQPTINKVMVWTKAAACRLTRSGPALAFPLCSLSLLELEWSFRNISFSSIELYRGCCPRVSQAHSFGFRIWKCFTGALLTNLKRGGWGETSRRFILFGNVHEPRAALGGACSRRNQAPSCLAWLNSQQLFPFRSTREGQEVIASVSPRG